MLPELELVTNPADPEDELQNGDSDEEEDSSDKEEQVESGEEMETFRKLQREGKAGDFSQEELKKYVGDGTKQSRDRAMSRFKEAVSHSPDQVLRFCEGGSPLWISGQLPKEIPDCELCGSRREFEFQIMPQMLHHLKLDLSVSEEAIDWGVLAVYTCKNSCNSQEKPYKREFLFKQFPSEKE